MNVAIRIWGHKLFWLEFWWKSMQFFLNRLSRKCKWNLSCFFLSLEAYTMRACDLCFTPKWMLQRKRLAGLGKETISSTTEMLSSKLPVSCHVSKSWRMFFGQSWGHKYWPIKITADSKQPIARVIVRGLDQLHAGATCSNSILTGKVVDSSELQCSTLGKHWDNIGCFLLVRFF